jgi:hypothetical protein
MPYKGQHVWLNVSEKPTGFAQVAFVFYFWCDIHLKQISHTYGPLSHSRKASSTFVTH